MKKLFMLMVMLVFSGQAYAGACWVNGEKVGSCQGSDCCGDGTWVPDEGDFWQEQNQSQDQSQSQSQDQTAIGVGVGVGIGYGEGGDATAYGGDASADASVGDITVNAGDVDVANEITNTNTNENTNNVDVTNTANGGDGGDASATAVVAEGAVDNDVDVTVNAGTTYHQVRQAPSIAQGSFAISGCSVGGNAGGSNKNGAAFLGFGWTPKECYAFMLAQAYQSIGQYKAVCDILRNTKTGKRLERDGIELPECLPEIVVVPAPVDLSEYATKEELNRAFEKSQMK